MAFQKLASPLSWLLFVFNSMALDVHQAVGTGQQTRLCLSRVSSLQKAEGYVALCTSIEALYQEQRNAASSNLALRQEGEQMQSSHAELEARNRELQAEIEELKEHQSKREKEWQSAAKKFQVGVASRDSQWQATVSDVEANAAKRFNVAAKKFQASEVLQQSLVDRDTHWQAIVRRLVSEKEAAEQQALASQKQKEAMEASTSAGKENRRTILLALSREEQKRQAESEKEQGLLQQISALQKENAQLVQRCV